MNTNGNTTGGTAPDPAFGMTADELRAQLIEHLRNAALRCAEAASRDPLAHVEANVMALDAVLSTLERINGGSR